LRHHLRSKRRKNAADRLASLRQWRNDADYLHDLSWDDIEATVDAALQPAKDIFTILAPPAA
jgi:hypothetical protein